MKATEGGPASRSVIRRPTALVLAPLVFAAAARTGWTLTPWAQQHGRGSPARAVSAICSIWRPVPSPGDGILQSVAGLASSDVWAVGDNGGLYPMIQHWDGTAWGQLRQTSLDGSLYGVAPLGPNDVWAVGYLEGGPHVRTFTEHWDGQRWRAVNSPSPGESDDYIYGASAAGSDVWAAGDYHPSGGTTLQPLYLRWDGTRWHHVREASGLIYGGSVLGIDVRTSEDAWAVGYQGTEVPFLNAPLIEHWDGTAWSIVPSPQPPGGSSALTEVSAISVTDAWAVGYDSRGPLIEHWDGSAWTRVQAPGTDYNLNGVVAISATDVWAVGSAASSAHWDGLRWTRYPTPVDRLSVLASVAAVSQTDIWTVGENADATTLTLHSKGLCP
jgi:hypothetical protein